MAIRTWRSQARTTRSCRAVARAGEGERAVAGHIGELMGIARKEADYASEQFVQWFVGAGGRGVRDSARAAEPPTQWCTFGAREWDTIRAALTRSAIAL